MLMTAQLPNYFVIADFGKIQEIDFEPRPKRRSLVVHRIKVPIDWFAIIEGGIPQQRKSMPADVVGFGQDCGDVIWKMLAEQSDPIIQVAGREKEFSVWLG